MSKSELEKSYFPRNLAEIRPDASHYTSEEAASLYVDHPQGLPDLDKNYLIIGPLGSGKTIMLKALCSKFTNSQLVKPFYVDLEKWTSSIAGETATFSQERTPPRGLILLEAMSLAINLGICESVGAFDSPHKFSSVWQLFKASFQTTNPQEIKERAKGALNEALKRSIQLPDLLPSVYTIASTIGSQIRVNENKILVLLVDQIDQVSGLYFSPVASLLKRSSDFVGVLASRPCPAAPETEVIPEELTAGDSYSIITLGRTLTGKVPYTFVLNFIKSLPLNSPYNTEIQLRYEPIANLMWPNLRMAINTIKEYVRLRSLNVEARNALYEAVRIIARGYEDIVRDGLRAWCPDPDKMLNDWRTKVITTNKEAPIGRSVLSFADLNLFGNLVDKHSQHLIRVCLKKSILLLSSDEHYLIGVLPRKCEIAPILFFNDSKFDIETFDSHLRYIEIQEKELKKWTKQFGPTRPRSKRVFISYWMSTEKSTLEKVVKERFENLIEIVTGALTGSPRWSPEIIDKIKKVNLILCDLTFPRREIFVEYGIAIGKHVPLIQCYAKRTNLNNTPAWIKNRQIQFFDGSMIEKDQFYASVAASLDNEPDVKRNWRQDSTGHTLESPSEIMKILLISPNSSLEVPSNIDSLSKEEGMEYISLETSHSLDNMEVIIKAVRSAGTLVLVFNGTATDYLACLAGGLFASKSKGNAPNSRKYDRKLFLCIANGTAENFIPGLLQSHPLSISFKGVEGLYHQLSERIKYIHDVVKKPIRENK